MRVYSNFYQISTYPLPNYEFEVLNELKDCSKRTDANCLTHTRFLFEMDSVPLDEQIKIVKELQDKLTRVVYSGSKSLHCIIEFDPQYENDCATNYKAIWQYLDKHYFNNKCDNACSNPSRLTRIPGVIRKDTGKEQKLLYNNPQHYFPDQYVLSAVILDKERYQLANAIKKSLDAKQTAFTDNGGYDPNGKCLQYDDIQHYLNTPYPKLKGNGDSSISLFKALRCCIKYHDAQTMECVLNKARNEHWTEHDLNRMMDNIKEKYIN